MVRVWWQKPQMKSYKVSELSSDTSFNQSFFEMTSFALTKEKGDKQQHKILDQMIELHLDIFQFKEVSEVLTRLNQIIEKQNSFIEEFVLNESFPIYSEKEGNAIGVRFKEEEFYEMDSLICHLGVKILERFYYYKNKIKDEKPEVVFFEEVFQKFPFPLIVLTGKGEIWLHNQEFSKLNILPTDLLEKENDQTFFTNEQTFKVKRMDWDKNEQHFILYLLNSMDNLNKDKRLKMSSFSELGIMASSIAHELNNPLMGISAAITLIEMDEDFSKTQQKTIREMKESAKRCGELVSVFLGFSKRITNFDTSEKITDSFKRALNLLRFRMIESNICLDCQIQKKQSFNHSINSSVITMVFYLILNEVITVHSKEKLINGQWSSSLKGKLTEKEGELILSIEGLAAKKIFETMGSLSLTRNLLNIDGLELSQSEFGIHLEVKNKLAQLIELDTQQELPFS